MGNKSIEVKYEDQAAIVSKNDNHHTSFENFTSHLRALFRIPAEECLTLRNSITNKFVSSNFKWSEFIDHQNLSLTLHLQVNNSIKQETFESKVVKSLFKILNKDKKVVALGVKISSNACICPKAVVFQNEFDNFLENYSIEFFDGSIGNFNANGICLVLGTSTYKQNFFICEFIGGGETLPKRYFQGDKRANLDSVYFDKHTHLLESKKHIDVKVLQSTFFKLNESVTNWLPGAILVTSNREVVALFTGGESQTFFTMNYIFELINDLHKLSDTSTQNQINQILEDRNSHFHR